jgi:hypothetical protein
MAQENFLINPPKTLRKRKRIASRKWRSGTFERERRKKLGLPLTGRIKHKFNPIGETLITIGANPMRRMRRKNPSNPWYGDSSGHRIAALMRWGKVRKGKISRHRKRVKHHAVRRVKRTSVKRRMKRSRWAPKAVRMQRKLALQSFWADKYGEILSHPRRKKYHYKTRGVKYYMKKHRRSRKRNTWFGQPRRHRKAAKKGWRRGHLISAGKRRRRVRHANPMVASANPKRRKRYHVKHRRSHSRRRSNPAIGAMMGQFTGGVMNVREWAPLAITGGLSAITGAVVPGMLGVVNPYMKYGVQIGLAIGGGIAVEKVVDRRHGQAWMLVGVAMVGYSLLKEFVIQPYFPQFAVGLGGYNDYYPIDDTMDVSQQVGAFPTSMGAFPTAMSAYPGVGEEVGAYPYDGGGY